MEKNLEQKEAINKLKGMAADINIGMLISRSFNGSLSTRPMATIEVDSEGCVWFFSRKDSSKVREFGMDNKIELVYSHPGKDRYLDITGHVTVVYDREIIKAKWKPLVKAWFPAGAEDPDLCLLKVRPVQAHYWDNETGKMVEFGKMIASIVTGKRLAEGVEGTLIVKNDMGGQNYR